MQLSDADKQYIPQALALLKNEASKNFRIEVTSDSMIFQDEQQEKQDRMDFLSAVSSFIQTALPVGQNAPELTPLLMEMLKFGVTAFRAGKQMEGLIDETADKFREQAKAQEGQPKPPSPEMQKAQMQMQGEQAKIQAQSQMKAQEMQMSSQLEMQKLQAQNELEKAKQEYQAQENQLKFRLEAERNAQDREMEAKLAQMKMNMERNTALLLAYVNNGAKIETARISAGVDDGTLAYADSQDMAQAMEHPLAPIANTIAQGNDQMTQTLTALINTLQQQHEQANRPKTVIRDENGKIQGVM
jgi:hypothetical protein